MTIEVKVPMLPESIADATVSNWYKKVGDPVTRDENLVDLETDKVMMEVPAPADGVLKEIVKQSGDTVHAEEVIAIIDTSASKSETAPASAPAKKEVTSAPSEKSAAPAAKSFEAPSA